MSSVAVVGAGAWGTALAIQAARAGRRVTLWARDPTALAAGRSPRLPGVALPERVTVTGELPGRCHAAILLAVPAQHLRTLLTAWQPQAPVVICAKGIETGTGRLPGEILAELHPDAPWAVLTGPNFAAEIAAGLPAAAVLATTDADRRARLIALLATPTFRLYGNDDPLGAQLGGAAKNVIAIAAGAVIGAGLGENARAALITRGVSELARLVASLGGRAETAAGLSGLGDLLLTCTGASSRNYSLGVALGRGEALADILAARQSVTEGVATAPALVARAAGVDLPICAAVALLLAGETTLPQAMAALLARPLRKRIGWPSKRGGARPLIHELRVYHCLPGRLPALLNRFATITLPIWQRHGIRQAGFWTVAIGESNQDLYYLLEWESLAERDTKWTAFQSDPEWLEKRAGTERDGQIVGSITNAILQPTAFSSVK